MYYVLNIQTSRNFVFAKMSKYEPILDTTVTIDKVTGSVYQITKAYTFKHAISELMKAREACNKLNNQLSAKLFKLGLNNHGS